MKLIKNESTGMELVQGITSKKISLPKFELALTMEATLSKPLVRSVFKGDNSQIGFTFVNATVKRFVDSFGFSTKMSPAQVEMLTVDTLENFGYESVEDIILFFKLARTGKFGSTGRGVDSNLIFGDWFPKYMDLKAQLREIIYDKEKTGHSLDQRGASYDDVMKRYKKDAKKSFTKIVSEHVEKITKNMDRQMLEDTIVDWEKDPKKKPYVKMLKAKRKVV